MKRAELKVGETYAVLAPSQSLEDRWGGSARARKVTVIDTEPVWKDTKDFHSWRHGDPETKPVANAEGQVVQAEVHVRKVEPGSYGSDEASRGVLVVEEFSFRDFARNGELSKRYFLRVVPLSQVRMTYKAYEAQVADVKRRHEDQRQARYAALREQEAAEMLASKRAALLNDRLIETDVTAIARGGKVVLAGPFEALEALVAAATREGVNA